MHDIHTDKGYSWISENGKIYLQRCHECGIENYAFSVATGKCAWCGYDAYKDNRHEVFLNENDS